MDGSSLVLKGLTASDSGAYTCMAHNAAGEDAKLHTVNVLGELRDEGQGEAGGPTVPGLQQPRPRRASTGGVWRATGEQDVGGLVQVPAVPTLGSAVG